METYRTLSELAQKWLTYQELRLFLKVHGYPNQIQTVRRWEKAGIIPTAKRVLLNRIEWRVYSKDGKDFDTILELLRKRTKKNIKVS